MAGRVAMALAAGVLAAGGCAPVAAPDAASQWPALVPLPEVLAPAAAGTLTEATTAETLALGAALRARADALRAAQP